MASDSQHEKWIRYALIVLAGVLAALLIFLFFQYQSLRRQQVLGMHQLHAAFFLEHHAPLPVSDAGVIRSWMTFDYVNKLFALPPDYLKAQLHIVDSRYPRYTISTAFLGQVQNAVRNYASSSKAVMTSTPVSPPPHVIQ
jgi:hypothetical protein